LTDTGKNNGKGLEENDLLARVAAGDQLAFAEMVRRYWNTIYSHGLVYLKSAPRAEEITQDIFLKIWQQKERLAEVQSFKHYIYVVGRNQVISQLRKKIAGKLEEPADILEDRLKPDAQLEYKETYRLIMEGIERLTPQQQLVFKMSRLEGLSYEQIGLRTGLSRNTVKGHMVLALNFLRIYFRDHGDITILCYLSLQTFLQK